MYIMYKIIAAIFCDTGKSGIYSWSHGTINIVGLSLEDYWLKINISSLIISVEVVAGLNLWYSFLF